MAPRVFAMRPPPGSKTHFSVRDLRQLIEKAQLSGELVTMCLERALSSSKLALALIPNDH